MLFAKMHLKSSRLVGSLLLLLAAVCLSTGAVLAKLAYAGGFDPLTMLTVRLGIATAGIWAVSPAFSRGKLLRLPPRRPLFFATAAQAVNFLTFFTALEWMDASTAMLLFWTYPIFVGLPLLLRGQVPVLPTTVRLLLTLIGVVLVIGPVRSEVSPLGVVLVLVAALSVAFQLRFLEQVVHASDAVTGTRWMLTGVFVCYGAIWLILRPPLGTVTIEGWLAVLGIGLITTTLARILLFAGIGRAGRLEAALTGSAELVFALVLIVVTLNEPLSPLQLVGAALIVTSIVLGALQQLWLSPRPASG